MHYGADFETLRPRKEILADYVHVLERIYDGAAYAGRLERLATLLDNSGRKQPTRPQHSRHGLGASKCCTGSFQTCQSRATSFVVH